MPTYLTLAHVLDFNYSPRRSKTIELQTDFVESDIDAAAKKLNLNGYEKELWHDYRFRLQRYAIVAVNSDNETQAVMLYRTNPNNAVCRFQAHVVSTEEAYQHFRQHLFECDPDHETIVLGPGDDDATEQRNHELLRRRE